MAPKMPLNLVQWNILRITFVTHIKHHIIPESNVEKSKLVTFYFFNHLRTAWMY